MGLLIWQRTITETPGGAERFALRLDNTLSQRGYKVRIVSGQRRWKPNRVGYDIDGQKVFVDFLPDPPIPVFGSMVFYASLAVCLLYRFSQYRVVLINSIHRAALPMIIISRLLRKRVICRDLGASTYHLVSTSQKRSLFNRFHLFVLRWADSIVAQNNNRAKWLADVGVPAHMNRVIPNGVDAGFYCPVQNQERLRLRSVLGLKSEAVYICWVGGLRPVKRPDLVVKAFSLVAGSFPQLELLLVGPDRYNQNIPALVESLELSDRVHFTGWTDNAHDYLQASDIFVNSSDSENHSNSVLEAMACGLAVVATHVDGNKHTIAHERSGLLVPVGDEVAMANALRTLSNDTALMRRLASGARQAVEERFSVERMITAYTDVLFGKSQ